MENTGWIYVSKSKVLTVYAAQRGPACTARAQLLRLGRTAAASCDEPNPRVHPQAIYRLPPKTTHHSLPLVRYDR